MNQIQENSEADVVGTEIGLLDVAVIIGENLRLLVLGPLAIGLMALAYAFTIQPTFTARASFFPPQTQQTGATAALQALGAVAGLAGAGVGSRNSAEQYIGLLSSKTVLNRVIDRFGLMNVYGAQYREHALRALEGNVKATTGKDGLIKIEVDDLDPKRAASVANGLIDELGVLLSQLALTEAQQRRGFFEKQLKDTREALTKAQLALQSSGVNANSLKIQPESAVSAVAELKAAVVSKEIALETMRQSLTATSPEYLRAANELAATKRQLAKTAASEVPAAGDSDYVTKYREYKYQETLFDLFARQFEIAKLDESRDSSTIQVVDRATPPELKSKPKKALIAIVATTIAALVMLLFVLARAALRAVAIHNDSATKLARLKAGIGNTFSVRRND